MSTPISEVITPYKSAIPRPIFERLQSELALRETHINSEKNVLFHKLNTISKDHDVLCKELQQTKQDYGDNSLELTELRRESSAELHKLRLDNTELRRELTELLRLRVETRQLTELKLELKQLNHSWNDLRGENEDLRKKVGIFKVLENENEVLRRKVEIFEALEKDYEVLKVNFGKEMEGLVKVNEKLVGENGKLVGENVKVKRLNESISEAATSKFKGMQKRIEVLETQFSKLLILTPPPIISGEKTVTISTEETSESLRPGKNNVLHAGTQSVLGTTHGEENSASSFSGLQGVSIVSKGLLRCKTLPPVAARTESSKSSRESPICINDSDEDSEPKGLKRKQLPEISFQSLGITLPSKRK